MDVPGLAELIYAYTSGYPFLVSRICKLMGYPEWEQYLSIGSAE